MKPEQEQPGLPTRAEVLRMPAGRDLDALVAERVMGWRCVIRDAYTPYGRDHCGTSPDGKGGWDGHGRTAIPYYSTDIAAAWPVLGAHHWPWRIAQDPAGWSEVVIQRWAGGEEDGDWEEVRATCENNEVPLGICRAALLARTRSTNVHGTIEQGT